MISFKSAHGSSPTLSPEQRSAEPQLRLLTTLISRCSSSTASIKDSGRNGNLEGKGFFTGCFFFFTWRFPKIRLPPKKIDGFNGFEWKILFTSMITGGTAMTMETSLDPDGCTVAVPCRLSSFQVRDAVVPHLFDGLLGLGAEQKCRPKDMLRKKCVSIYIYMCIYIYPSSNPKSQWKLTIYKCASLFSSPE